MPAPTIPESWESNSHMGDATLQSYLLLNWFFKPHKTAVRQDFSNHKCSDNHFEATQLLPKKLEFPGQKNYLNY